MSEPKSKYTTTAAFPEPNYTQTPNDFFAMLPDMEHSEVNVTLVMIRNTFGFHRSEFKMGLSKLAKAAGLSRNAAKDGAEAAEKRGTFRRSNPDSLGEAEWELVVGQPVTTPQPVTGDGQPVTTGGSMNDSQVGVKEKKERKETGTLVPEGFGLDWQVAAGQELSPADQFTAQARDAANLIDMGCLGAGELAYAFMIARHIVIPESKVKGNRKAAREMLEMKVRPENVTRATLELMEKNMTVTDLFSVSKTAIDLANKPIPVQEYTRLL